MAGKQITIDCNEELKVMLCEAINMYAEAAYPPGGSECAQVARETLLDAARSIEEQFAAKGHAEVSRRLRSQLKACLDYYAEAPAGRQNDIHTRVLQLQKVVRAEAGKTG